MRHFHLRIVLCAGPLLLAGCTSRDPYHRTDVWEPTGANAANIAAMVVDPHDLIRGHGVSRYLAKEPVAAVEQSWKPQQSGGAGGGSGGAAAPGASAASGG